MDYLSKYCHLIINYFANLDYKYNLIWGVIFFIAGSILLLMGGHFLQIEHSVNKVMRQLFPKSKYKRLLKWIFIILGPLMIAGGGMFSTRGWNDLALKSQLELQRNNLRRAVIQEWAINNLRLNRPPLVGTVYVTENDQKLGTKIFPAFNTNAIESFLASGLLDISKPDDLEFFVTLSNYNRCIKETNEIFKLFNDDIMHIKGEDMINKKVKRAKEYQKKIWKSPIFQNLFKCHRELGEILKTKFKKLTEEQFPKKPQEGQPEQEIPNNESAVKPTNEEKQ